MFRRIDFILGAVVVTWALIGVSSQVIAQVIA